MEPIKDPENHAPASARPIDRLRYLLSCVVTNGEYPAPPFSSDEWTLRTRCAIVVSQATEALEAARRVSADYDALVKERDEARASAEGAGRLLDEHRNGCVWMTWQKEAIAQRDAALKQRDEARAEVERLRREAGKTAPTPADPTNPAPAPASGAAQATQKEP